MNPCGKKKPEIQKLAGCPVVNQLFMNSTLSRRSLNQESKGFKDG